MPNLSLVEKVAREKALHGHGYKFVNVAGHNQWYYGSFLLFSTEKKQQIANERVKLKKEFAIIPGEYIIPIPSEN